MPEKEPPEGSSLPSTPSSVQTAFKRNSGAPIDTDLPGSSHSNASNDSRPISQSQSQARPQSPTHTRSHSQTSGPPSPHRTRSDGTGRPGSAHRRQSSSEQVPGLAQPVGARVKGTRTSLVTEAKGGVAQDAAAEKAKDNEADKDVEEVVRKINEGKIREERKGEVELDEFGLPVKPRRRAPSVSEGEDEDEFKDAEETLGDNSEVEGKRQAKKEEGEKDGKGHVEAKEKAEGGEGSKDHPPEQAIDSETGKPTTKPRSDSNVSAALSTRSRGDTTLAQIIEAGAEGADEARGGVSQFSHQALTIQKLEEKDKEEEEKWQDMPAYGKFDLYDDEGRMIAKGVKDFEDSDDEPDRRGGAGKGYTRIKLDDDAKSQTSMDENTGYLFKGGSKGTHLQEEEDEVRDPLSQMQATKDLLTEGQRIAYVGVVRLSMVKMVKDMEKMEPTKAVKKEHNTSVESTKMWSQKMIVRLYAHMDIDSSEQIMIEQLAEHGVEPSDLTPALMQNARVKNIMTDEAADESKPSLDGNEKSDDKAAEANRKSSVSSDSSEFDPPPAYDMHQHDEMTVQRPSDFLDDKHIDIDIRWTVLCDLFLVLIADSIYDSRSRSLLEEVGQAMQISWVDVCRFEKRITDALEMQEQADRENWDEAEHMESRRKLALKRRYMVMGLATVGGGLVIGLSAGLLAPLIGSGLAAGFTAIGVTGTAGFLGGTAGAAIITTGSVVSGGVIAVRASNRRTGAVKTFEYRPLHNNKRVNLIVTVSGWMNGKVDDVRLPFSTVDPIMGDIYSVLWEPDVLQSIGDTIRILATEALTSGLQQALAATVLTTLMSALSAPVLLAKLSYLLDNPWSVSCDRADAAGLILADSLVDRNLGARPITLVGFSLGARVIFSCLKELAKKGAYGLIQNVYLFGSPVVAKKDDWLKARTVISGRFVNGYASNDWIIGYLFRATSGGLSRVAGLAAVPDIPGLENHNVTSFVNGHMAYRNAMPKLLREVGWEVESDEFTEIEDPDPENHEARQRELIREIEDARKEAQKEAQAKKKSKFGWLRRGPKDKKSWETYEAGEEEKKDGKDGNGGLNSTVLFDIEAIKRELESEQFEVKQLESTLPPMQIHLSPKPDEAKDDAEKKGSPTKEEPPAEKKEETPKPDRLKNGHAEPPRPNYDSWEEYDAQLHGDPRHHPPAEPSMSFEPSPAGSASVDAVPRKESPAKEIDPSHHDENEKMERPPLKSAATEPSGMGAAGVGLGVGVGVAAGVGVGMSIDHNAWMDEDDEFSNAGKGEATMSFE